MSPTIHIAIFEGLKEVLSIKYPRFQFTLHHENLICPYIEINRKNPSIVNNSYNLNSHFIVTENDYLRFGGSTTTIDYSDPEFVEKVIKTFATINCNI